MNKMRRVGNIFVGFITVVFGLLIILDPVGSPRIIIGVLCVTLLLEGIRNLWFYLTMARHMVGGRKMLYRAVIVIDMGLFALSLSTVPFIYVIIYLAAIHLFTGAIDIMRANESRSLQSGSWKMQFAHGLVNVIMAIICLVFIKTTAIAAIVYGVGLVYSGVMRIIEALRRTAIVYIV